MKKCKEPECYSDATCRDGRCGEHTKGTRTIKSHISNIKPKSNQPHLGVELECVARDGLAWKMLRSQHRIPHHDGSLPTFGCEFKMCVTVARAIKWIPTFAARLASIGGSVNSRCGLHVHLDARCVSWERREAFAMWLGSWQDWWFNLMPPSRRDNVYCQRVPSETPSRWTHYQWVHPTDKSTIEIRIHSGTLNRHKVHDWLCVMADLMDLLRSDKPLPPIALAPTAQQLVELFPREAGRKYLKSRIQQLGQLHSSSQLDTYEEVEA